MIRTYLSRTFEDAVYKKLDWDNALAEATNSVFLTWYWQRAWWDCFGRGQLLLIAAEKEDKIVAIVSLFAETGMIFFVGSGGSDYLDFIGDTSDPEVLDALLEAARSHVPDFVGFRFYLVPDNSPTGARLQEAARRLDLDCYDEGALPAPALDLQQPAEAIRAVINKKSLLRHERFFTREGTLAVEHLRDGNAILPHLESFFAQHIARWSRTPYPSLFLEEKQQQFYRHLTRVAADTGWLRFTRICWNGEAIAFHFGFCYHGRYLWYKPSFAIEWAARSPGEVLLRQLLLAAVEEDAHTFDFGIGDEAFKRRFATHTPSVRTWGLYPK